MFINRTASGTATEVARAVATNTPAKTPCSHRFGYWDAPFMMTRLVKFTDENEYKHVNTVIQTRQCLECGEAELRTVGK